MARVLIFTLIGVFGCLLCLPVNVYASDPLLAGYGGPGGGEQVVLGSQLSGGHGGSSAAATSSRTLRAAAPARTAAVPAAGSTVAPAPAVVTRAANPASGHGSPKPSAPHNRAARTPARTPAATVVPTAVPERIAYPARAGSAGALPLSGGDVIIVLLAFCALVLTALGLRRLSSSPPSEGSPPQARPR
jgi:hypothetical protein